MPAPRSRDRTPMRTRAPRTHVVLLLGRLGVGGQHRLHRRLRRAIRQGDVQRQPAVLCTRARDGRGSGRSGTRHSHALVMPPPSSHAVASPFASFHLTPSHTPLHTIERRVTSAHTTSSHFISPQSVPSDVTPSHNVSWEWTSKRVRIESFHFRLSSVEFIARDRSPVIISYPFIPYDIDARMGSSWSMRTRMSLSPSTAPHGRSSLPRPPPLPRCSRSQARCTRRAAAQPEGA